MAASNALFWASHIRTKQTKWLDNDLHEMEEKVQSMMKLIEEDGDSFAKKAQLYFQRRPELTNYVEEIHKSYKALADRYDRTSGELQKANHTIATAFPDQVELAMQDDDEDDSFPKAITSDELTKFSLAATQTIEDCSAPKKLVHHRRITSQISKEKAQEDLDRLQKEILLLQTEKTSYESAFTRYLEIQRRIAEVQEQFCGLQDALGASSIVVEDHQVRALMVATSIKSCEDRLVSLEEQHNATTKEARVESERIQDGKQKLKSLKGGEYGESEMETTENYDQDIEVNYTEVSARQEERLELQSRCQKVKELFKMSSETSVMELAEKIDELVDKVFSLELTVSSQNSQIKRLRSGTDELQKHLRSLEEDNVIRVDDSNNLTENKSKEAEDELQQIQHLEKCLQDDEGNFQRRFKDAGRSPDNLAEKLQPPKHQEHGDIVVSSQEGETHVSNKLLLGESKEEEDYVKIQNALEDIKQESEVPQTDLLQTDGAFDHVGELQIQVEPDDNIPDLQNLPLNGLEDGQMDLLAKCTSILLNYKDTKKRLSEIEKNSQEYQLETMAQVKELQNANASKDEEIQLLKEILTSLQDCLNVNVPEDKEKSRDQVAENLTKTNETLYVAETESPHDAEDIKLCHVNETQASSALENKFREEIDILLEDNLDFWLRFCTAYHQIQEFQTTYEDLNSNIDKLNKIKNQKGNATVVVATEKAVNRDAVLLIDKNLRELNTQLHVWLEKNAHLNGELKCRSSSLCSIQDEISRVSKASETEDVHNLAPYQAAKFQGEVLNMQLENNKVAKELQAGLDYVRGLQVEVSMTLSKLNKNLELPGSRNHHHRTLLGHLSTKTRIPLRTFLLGTKPKKSSIFSCMNPALQKQYSDLRSAFPR